MHKLFRRFLMKITLLLVYRKIMAFIMSLFVSLGICAPDIPITENIQRGEENSVTEFNKENSDYYLSIDAGKEVHLQSQSESRSYRDRPRRGRTFQGQSRQGQRDELSGQSQACRPHHENGSPSRLEACHRHPRRRQY